MSTTLPLLDATETRVLGSLMEKSRTTPDYYPMTLNGLTAACNQKSARKPVYNFTENEVIEALDRLKRKGLISTATGGSSRSIKYKHNFAIVFPLVPAELAIICLLLLRGPQTPGELNTNSGRLYEFESLEEVNEVLQKLSDQNFPYLVQIPRKPGQKEVRFMHLLNGEPDVNVEFDSDETSSLSTSYETRLQYVENELAELKIAFNDLVKELKG